MPDPTPTVTVPAAVYAAMADALSQVAVAFNACADPAFWSHSKAARFAVRDALRAAERVPVTAPVPATTPTEELA